MLVPVHGRSITAYGVLARGTTGAVKQVKHKLLEIGLVDQCTSVVCPLLRLCMNFFFTGKRPGC